MSKPPKKPRREESLSLEQIVDACIVILDEVGESGLTFRALSEHLATGPGALYGHIASKSDLLTAASDCLIARALGEPDRDLSPEDAIKTTALVMFDTMAAHPWVGSALMQAPGQLPTVRVLERLGQQIRALDVAAKDEWAAACSLLNYVLGVGGQNAANAQLARRLGADREEFLGTMAGRWLQLPEGGYPFTRSAAQYLAAHDDRADFLFGVHLLVQGLRQAQR